jgi:hypothetical protein
MSYELTVVGTWPLALMLLAHSLSHEGQLSSRTAELGEPRRLSVRGCAVPGRTLEAGGAPQFR